MTRTWSHRPAPRTAPWGANHLTDRIGVDAAVSPMPHDNEGRDQH